MRNSSFIERQQHMHCANTDNDYHFIIEICVRWEENNRFKFQRKREKKLEMGKGIEKKKIAYKNV